MSEVPNARELAMEPDLWAVYLREGSGIEVLAHGHKIDGADCLFALLSREAPNFDVTSLRIPLALLPGSRARSPVTSRVVTSREVGTTSRLTDAERRSTPRASFSISGCSSRDPIAADRGRARRCSLRALARGNETFSASPRGRGLAGSRAALARRAGHPDHMDLGCRTRRTRVLQSGPGGTRPRCGDHRCIEQMEASAGRPAGGMHLLTRRAARGPSLGDEPAYGLGPTPGHRPGRAEVRRVDLHAGHLVDHRLAGGRAVLCPASSARDGLGGWPDRGVATADVRSLPMTRSDS